MTNSQPWAAGGQPPHRPVYGPGGTAAPATTINTFTIWTIASAIIFVFAGGLAFTAIAQAVGQQDLALGIVFAAFSAAGFIGVILSRIGAVITKAGSQR